MTCGESGKPEGAFSLHIWPLGSDEKLRLVLRIMHSLTGIVRDRVRVVFLLVSKI